MLLSCLLTACSQQQVKAPVDLRCEFLTEPLSVDAAEPVLAWKLPAGDADLRQTAYQILVATERSLLREGVADLWDSGKTLSDNQTTVRYGGSALSGNKLVYWKVRIWDAADRASGWSAATRFGSGLTVGELNEAQYIAAPPVGSDGENGIPSPLLRHRFDWQSGEALLYVNSLGYHEVWLNGEKVGDRVLAPAVAQFNKRSLYVTYDLAPYLRRGDNDLVIWTGSGWYSNGLPGVAYDGPVVKAVLSVKADGGWTNILHTDKSWQCAESGYSTLGRWNYGDFGGERVDGSVLNDLSTAALDRLQWSEVEQVDIPSHTVSPQMVEGNVVTENIKPVKITQIGDGAWLVDMGKVFTGWASIRFHNLAQGNEVSLKYGDHFNPDGSLANQRQRDFYIAKAKAAGKEQETFCNRFNYHCFQYISISGIASAPSLDDITGYAIQTGYSGLSSFECSDPDLNAIHNMVQRTLRNLSLGGYLVDCTHIERLGYGGDGHASTVTAQTMFNLAPLYANWLNAWEDCIRDDGGLPHTAPNPYSAGGGPYWCAFIVTAPWQTYLNYGDADILAKYYPVMKHWLKYVDAYTVDGLLKRWPDTDYRGWYLGDWATPTGINQTDPASIDLVDNCVISECYILLEKIARLLGKDDEAKGYAERKAVLDAKIQATFYRADSSIYATGTQIDNIYPMLVGVTPYVLIPAVTKSLFERTENLYAGHLSTGLVGIPVLVEWAVKNRQPDFVYNMLKKRDYPGYLYMLDNGGTATWEHWNGERSRLHNCYNGIGSWFYQAVGGIQPVEDAPGYREIRISPQIPKGITWAKVTKDTPYGVVTVHWELKDGKLDLDITVPPGCRTVIDAPEGIEIRSVVQS